MNKEHNTPGSIPETINRTLNVQNPETGQCTYSTRGVLVITSLVQVLQVPTGWYPSVRPNYLPYSVLSGIKLTKLAHLVLFGNGSLSLPVFLYFSFFPSPLRPSIPNCLCLLAKKYTVGTPFYFFASVCLYCGFSDPPIPPFLLPQFPFLLPCGHAPAHFPPSPSPPSSGQSTDSAPPPQPSFVYGFWFLDHHYRGLRKDQQALPARSLPPPCLSLPAQR